MNNSLPEKLSTICDSLFQKVVDEAIEQHRIKGEATRASEEITPLANKLKERKNCT